MASQKGKDLLLKVDGDGSGGYARSPACGRARSLSTPRAWMSRTQNPPATGANCWKAPASGTRASPGAEYSRMRTSMLSFAASCSTARSALAGDRSGFRHIVGAFQITGFELTGKHDGEVAFDLTL